MGGPERPGVAWCLLRQLEQRRASGPEIGPHLPNSTQPGLEHAAREAEREAELAAHSGGRAARPLAVQGSAAALYGGCCDGHAESGKELTA